MNSKRSSTYSTMLTVADLHLQERSIDTCCLLASSSVQSSLIVSLAIGLLVNRVDTQKDGSCLCQSADFFYPLKPPHSALAIRLPVSQSVAYIKRSASIRSSVLPDM